jgi:hypothetical protein
VKYTVRNGVPGVLHGDRFLPMMAGAEVALDSVADRVLRELGSRALAHGMSNGDMSWMRAERATSSTPSTPYYTGPNSLFGALGLERDVISTRVQPFGLADRLPVQMSNTLWPQFAYFTGFAASTGSEPSGVCDDPPTAGAGAVCVQTAQFGRFSRQSRVLEVNRMRQQINRAEMTDLTLLNGPLVGGMGSLTVPGSTPGDFNIRNEAYMRMVEVGVDFQLWFARMIYEGNPANNTGGGGYREFPGLDILVGTGHVDANTNTSCPSLDSVVTDFKYGNVTLSNPAMTSFINGLTQLMRYLRIKAAGQNMGDVNWTVVMRPGLFYELTAAWPCNYATYRCITTQTVNGQATGNGAFVDGMDMANMRDEMRNGSYLVIDGLRIPVIQDNTIREDTNTINSSVSNGSFASDVYILPLSVRGRSVLYWELFDFSQGLSDLSALAPGAGAYYWTDGGRYLWHLKPPTNWCVQVLGKVEPRIILRTPQLAARITNVQYQTVLHEPDVDPTDPYFVRGGVTAGYTAPTFHAQWTTVS